MSAERTQGCAVTYGRAVRYQSEICVADRHDTARCLNGPLSVLIEVWSVEGNGSSQAAR